MPKQGKKRLGRPITRRQDLEPFTAHLTPEAKNRLLALAQVTGQPAYSYMEQAFWLLWEGLPDHQRDAAHAILRVLEDARAQG